MWVSKACNVVSKACVCVSKACKMSGCRRLVECGVEGL